MGAYEENDTAVRGSAREFPAADHMKTGNAAKGWVLLEGEGVCSSTGSGDTYNQDICGQATGNSGGLGGQPAYLWCLCERYRLRCRGETPGTMVEAEGGIRSAEGPGRSDFVSGKGATVIVIWQAWREQGRVGGGEHGHQRIGARQIT